MNDTHHELILEVFKVRRRFPPALKSIILKPRAFEQEKRYFSFRHTAKASEADQPDSKPRECVQVAMEAAALLADPGNGAAVGVFTTQTVFDDPDDERAHQQYGDQLVAVYPELCDAVDLSTSASRAGCSF